MLKKRTLQVFIPLCLLLVLIFVVPPPRLLQIKSGAFRLFRRPLTLFYRVSRGFSRAAEGIVFFFEYPLWKRETERLRMRVVRLEEARLENERLRKILDLRQREPYDFIAAQVIGRDPTNWLNSMIINKGTAQGIYMNQPVMSAGSLVGKVIETAPHTAKILLISDVNSRVVAMIQRTRIEGMLEGIGGGMCRLKYLPNDAGVELGDTIISAGVGGVYPKELLIGKVESVRVERGGMYKNCIVRPAVPLSGLEEVLCIKSDSAP